jgi:hypothetical protein
MTVACSIKLSDEERLNILRRVDEFRQWRSLDEKRYCLVCGEMITGRQIQVIGDTPRNAQLRLSCPTEHCKATSHTYRVGVSNGGSLDNNCDGGDRVPQALPDHPCRSGIAILPKKKDKQYETE